MRMGQSIKIIYKAEEETEEEEEEEESIADVE